MSSRRSPKTKRSPTLTWKKVKAEDVVSDKMRPIGKHPPAWDTFRTTEDLTRWVRVNYTSKRISHLLLQEAISKSYNTHPESDVTIPPVPGLTWEPGSCVCIPFYSGKTLEVVSFKPKTCYEIPDMVVHMVQRRASRMQYPPPSERIVQNVISGKTASVCLPDAGRLYKEGGSIFMQLYKCPASKLWP